MDRGQKPVVEGGAVPRAGPRSDPRSSDVAGVAIAIGEDARRAAGAMDRGEEPGRPEKDPQADLVKKIAAIRRGEGSADVVALLGRLRARDAEVRAHESAHVSAGGRYVTSGASFSYQKGPDGKNYAVGGEVGIDSAPIPGDPAETERKMRIVRAAALAPAEPSGADLAIAAAAAQAEAQARAELAAESYARVARPRGASLQTTQGASDSRENGLDMLI